MDLSMFGTPTGLRDDYTLEGNEELYFSYNSPLIIDKKTAFIPLQVFFYDPLDKSVQYP
jgi:hypothetical protein